MGKSGEKADGPIHSTLFTFRKGGAKTAGVSAATKLSAVARLSTATKLSAVARLSTATQLSTVASA